MLLSNILLYEQGLIYRGKRLVNWDPVLMSAVSDLEVESEEEDGFLWHITYPFSEGAQMVGDQMVLGLTVATTRPETMLGDVAVMVHPEDERYRHLIGKHVNLPLCNRAIPVIADDYVDALSWPSGKPEKKPNAIAYAFASAALP